jgi:hypothetical protein
MNTLTPTASRRLLSAGLLLALFAPAALASDLNLNVTSGGQSTVMVAPGASVSWAVTGELSDGNNQGVAMFSFNMAFNGGALSPAVTPGLQPMLNFTMPLGVTNPAGFGGTSVGGGLLQVGGAQNTIVNVFAPFPTGNVITGVAAQGSPQQLASGTLAAPMQVGTYTLSLSSVMANAVRTGSTGSPNWAVDACGVGSVGNLQVIVVGLTANVATLSVLTTGTQLLSLDAGAARAGRIFFLLGTYTGTSPGLPLPNGMHLPLNPSLYLNVTASNPNSPPLTNSLGFLDGNGHAASAFHLPHVPPAAAGLVLHHAYVLLQPIDFISNPVSLTLVP